MKAGGTNSGDSHGGKGEQQGKGTLPLTPSREGRGDKRRKAPIKGGEILPSREWGQKRGASTEGGEEMRKTVKDRGTQEDILTSDS